MASAILTGYANAAAVVAALDKAGAAVPASVLTDAQEPTGFLDPTAVGVAYDASARTITLTQTGGVVYYWRGTKTTLASPWTSDPHDEGDGIFYLFSTDGTDFAWSTSPWSFTDIQVAFASVSGTGTVKFALRECHGLMPWQTHLVLHDRIGTYRASGGTLDGATYVVNTDSDAATTPGYQSAVIIDEDLPSTVPATADGAYTTMRIGAGGVATFAVADAFPFRVADPAVANTYLLLNNPATGAETAGINNRFYNVYDILMPVASDSESQKYRRLLLQPQVAYTSLAAAQAEDPRSLSLGTLSGLTPEFVFNARITFNTASGSSNTGKCKIATGGVTYITGSAMSQVSISGFNTPTAQNVLFTPAGRIDATNVQEAIEELDSEKAHLAGVTGGQTLIGGTGVSDKLTLQGTSGNGTATATAFEVKTGDNGALTALTVANNGQVTLQGAASTDLPVMGDELLTAGNWTAGEGWAESPDGTFTHTSSSGTATLTHSATIVSGAKYQISWVVSGRNAGTFTVAVGGVATAAVSVSGNAGPTATATTVFTITPTTTFDGAISSISLKQLTAVSTAELVGKSSAGTAVLEFRLGNSNTNCFVGVNSGGYNTTGTSNSAVGANAFAANTTGTSNSAVGANALAANTTGFQNVAVGGTALAANTTGYWNMAIGATALQSNTTGVQNAAIGYGALFANTTGTTNVAIGTNSQYYNTEGNGNTAIGWSALGNCVILNSNTAVGNSALNRLTTGGNNTALGAEAGFYHSDGSTGLTTASACLYLGYRARAKNNSDSNSVVIGGNTPIGLGANTTVIGTSATTITRLFGNVATGVDAPSAAFHAIKTTEQLRLGYDASNYASFTVDSSGRMTLTATGTTLFTDKIIENTVSGEGIILKSPDGTRYKLTVANGGTLAINAV